MKIFVEMYVIWMPIHMQKCKYCSRKPVKVGKRKRYFELFRISTALFQFTNSFHETSAGILQQSMETRNMVGIGLSQGWKKPSFF
jgi:hypothetical protein